MTVRPANETGARGKVRYPAEMSVIQYICGFTVTERKMIYFGIGISQFGDRTLEDWMKKWRCLE